MKARLYTTSVSAPAAGSALTFAPSQTDLSKVLSISATLSTGSESGERAAALELLDQNGLVYAVIPPAIAQPAEFHVKYTWAQGIGNSPAAGLAVIGAIAAPFPELWLEPGDSIKIPITGFKTGDSWGVAVVRYLAGHHWEDLEYEEQVAAAVGL